MSSPVCTKVFSINVTGPDVPAFVYADTAYVRYFNTQAAAFWNASGPLDKLPYNWFQWDGSMAFAGGYPPGNWSSTNRVVGITPNYPNPRYFVSGPYGSNIYYEDVLDKTDSTLTPEGTYSWPGSLYGGVVTISYSPPAVLVFKTSPTLSNPTQEIAYSMQLLASGYPSPTTWGIIAGALPTGITLNTTTGLISGTTTDTPGTFNFTVLVSNVAMNNSMAFSFVLQPAIYITTVSPLPSPKTGIAYSVTLASAGNPATAWSVISGAFPTGLSLNSGTGEISGTPSGTPGPYTVEIGVSDGTVTNGTTFSITLISSVTVSGSVTIPDHFARWNGPNGLVTMAPVGSHVIDISGVYPDAAVGVYVKVINDPYCWDYASGLSGSCTFQLSQWDTIGWSFQQSDVLGNSGAFLIPIVDETPAAPPCTFDGTTQATVFGVAITGTSTSIEFFFCSQDSASAVGTYNTAAIADNEVVVLQGNALYTAAGTQTCISGAKPIGVITVT